MNITGNLKRDVRAAFGAAWGKPKICPICHGEIPFVVKNSKGVQGWDRCRVHAAAPQLVDAAYAAGEKLRELGAKFPEANCAKEFLALRDALKKAGATL